MTSFTRALSSRRIYVSAALIVALLVLAALVASSGSTNASAQQPTMIWRATITDAATGAAVAGAIYLDDVQYCADSACAPLTTAEVPIPADGQKHTLQVQAKGYQRWEIEIAGQTKDGRRVLGPVLLKRAGPPQQQA